MTKREVVFLKRPTVSGPVKLVIGKQEFGVPEGTKLHWLNDTKRVCWVMLPGGGIRALGSRGEMEVPSHFADEARARYFATDVEIREN